MTRALSLLMLCFVCFNARAAWYLNTNLPSASNVTPDVKLEDQQYLNIFYRELDGTPHVAYGFGGSYGQVWDVNLSNSTSRVFTLTNDFVDPHGIAGSAAAITVSNRLLVCATANWTNEFWSINPSSGAITKVMTNSDKIVQYVATDPNGVVVMGTYGHARIDSYNPANGQVIYWGCPDAALTGEGNYMYYVAADTNYIYGAIKDDTLWYLGVIRRSDTNYTVVWKELNPTGMELWTGSNSVIYAKRNIGASVTYWQLTNEVPVSIGSLPAERVPLTQSGHVDSDVDNWDTVQGWDVDPNYTVYSITGSISSASLRWKKHADSVWESLTETNNWQPVAATFQTLQAFTGNSLLWIGTKYSPVGSFVPGGNVGVLGPYKHQSTRDVLQISASQVYMAGYHLNTFRWNPQSTWTRTPSVQDFSDPAYNPYDISETWGKYHTLLTSGYNGRIFVGTVWDRTGTGGELGWYDPTTGSIGSERTTFQATVNEPFDLKSAESGTKLVYTAIGGNIFVWSVAGFTNLTNFTVLGGAPVNKVVEYANGTIFGISGSNTVGFTTTGTQLFSNNLPFSAWSLTQNPETDYRKLTLGPDNYVWIPQGTVLYRIKPSDGTYTNLLSITSGPDKIVFNGGDAYLYGGTQIYKLANLLTNSLSPATATIGTAHFY